MAIHTAIGERKLLIVLDDVWKVEEGLAFKVGGPHCAYIVTTRFPQLAIQFAADGATAVEELNEGDSMAFWHNWPQRSSRANQMRRKL